MNRFDNEKFSNSSEPIEPQVIQTEKSTNLNEESLLVILDELQLLQEQIEYWRNMDAQKNEELQTLEQELWHTNQELIKAFSFQHTSFAQMKELATEILATEKSASECLAELISTIYNLPVKSEELEFNVKLHYQTKAAIIAKSNTIIAESRELRKNLKVHVNSLKTQFAIFKDNCKQTLTETKFNTVITTNHKRTTEP